MNLQVKHISLQKKLMELMLEVDNICRKNDIIYYLHGGNVLGAVRNRGFIPWDDDIDVIMTPENWKKFHKIFQKEKRVNRALVCRENNPEHPYLFARYVDTTTAYTFRWKAFNTGLEGIGIDFVIFERISSEILLQQKYKKWMIVLGELVGRRGIVNREGDIKLYKKLECLKKVFGEKRIINFVERRKEKYVIDDGDSYIQVAPHQNFNWSCSAEFFNEPEEVEMERHLLYAPTNPKGFVRSVYGDDWMMLPDPKQRRVHMTDPRAFCSINVSDNEAEKEASNWIDSSKYDDCYTKQKPLLIKRALYEKKMANIDARIRCNAYTLELCYKLEHCGENLQKLLENNKYTYIIGIFSKYIDEQLTEYKKMDITTNIQTKEYRAPYVIKIPYDKLNIICMSLTFSGQYFVAQKILDMHFGIKGERPEELKALQKLIDINREWSIARYDKNDWNEVKKISEKWLLLFPYHVDFIYGNLMVMLRESYDDSIVKEVIKQAECALKIHPNSMELLSVVAYAEMKLGLLYRAKKHFLYILEESCNGILNLEIEDVLKELEYIKIIDSTSKSKSINSEKNKKHSEIHEKLLQLLREVDDICEENDIPYFIEPSLAWEAINKGSFLPNKFSNKVIMRSADRKRFIEAVRNTNYKNRIIECYETNKNYADFSIRYCDQSTILLNYKEIGLYDKNNISVEVIFICPQNGNKFERKRNFLLLSAIKNASRPNIFAISGIKNKISALAGLIIMNVFGKKWVKEKCWQWVYKPDDTKKKIKGKIKSYRSKWITLPKIDFGVKQIAYLDNIPLPVPTNYIEYVKCRSKYSGEFSCFDLKNDSIIGISEANGESFLKEIKKREIKRRVKYDFKIRIFNKKIRRYSPYIIRGWEYLQRSFIRIEMMRKYSPIKKRILDLYQKQEYRKLETILKEYINNIIFFSRKKLALYFDADIFRITWDIMARNGDGKIVENILPEISERYIEIKMKNEKGGLHSVYMQWELDMILKFLEKDKFNCPYLYADLLVYGLKNPNIKIWCKRRYKEIEIVVMQYHKSFQVYVKQNFIDVDDIVQLIKKQSPNSISARQDIIEALTSELPEYFPEYGVVIKYPEKESGNINEILSLCEVQIEEATIDDCMEIAKLIFTDSKLSAAYTIETLVEELQERIITGMGRSFVIRDKDKIVAHVATYAETDSFAIVGGFIVDYKYRDRDYAYYLEIYIEHILKIEGKSHVGMVIDKRLRRAFERKGCQVIGCYGNLSLENK